MARVTLSDVARAAGVSQATASIVLSQGEKSRMSQQTSERVKRIAEAMGYRRNETARALYAGHSTMVGLIGDHVATSPFAGTIIEGAQERAWAEGRLLVVANTDGAPALERAAVDQMLGHQVGQFLYASMYNRNVVVPEALHAYDVVVLNANDPTGRVRSVAPDEVRGGREATEYLIGHGHQRIGLINIAELESGLPATLGRYEGYCLALKEAGIAYHPDLVRAGDGRTRSGYEHARELLALSDPPTAIFCLNDRTAWGALQAATGAGLRIPEDLSIIGFDNQELIAAETQPGLTTMKLPLREMGAIALDVLLASGEESDAIHPSRQIRIHCPLIERGSVSSPRTGLPRP